MTFEQLTANTSIGKVSYYKGGSGHPLIYIHSENGFFHNGAIKELIKKFQVFIPIIPGFENTNFIESLNSIEDLSSLVSVFMDEVISVTKIDIIGYSLGANIAAKFAVDFPDKLDQVIFISPYGFDEGGIERPAKTKKSLSKYYEKFEEKSFSIASFEKDVFAKYNIKNYDKKLISDLESSNSLKLVLLGTEDKITSSEVGHKLRALLKNIHFIYIYDSGNAIEIDQPERMIKIIEDFLLRGEAFIVNWEGRSEEESPKRDN